MDAQPSHEAGRFGLISHGAWGLPWDNEPAFRYGYRPQGRAEDHAAEALAADAKLPSDPVGDWYQGGPYCSDEFDSGIVKSPT